MEEKKVEKREEANQQKTGGDRVPDGTYSALGDALNRALIDKDWLKRVKASR